MRWRWSQATIALAVSIPLLWSFGSIVTGARVCAYRDTAHFYYPLYAWTSRCWSRGEIPLWNPQDNIGLPVVAEATSAVFYPGQLLFALPLPYPLKFNLYLVAHVVLAAAGAYALARELLAHQSVSGNGVRGASETRDRDCPCSGAAAATNPAAFMGREVDHSGHLAAGLCAVAYAFGGTVLFQYCNVVFFVGAAWLPWALLAADRMLTQRRLAWAVVLGICLALMVLGGDPQTAYHTGLLAALLAWLRRGCLVSRHVASRQAAEPPDNSPSTGSKTDGACRTDPSFNSLTIAETHRFSPWSVRRHALFLLLTAALAGILLSAVQVVPAVSWTSVSDRASGVDSGSVWRELFGKPPAGTHREQRYDFSVAPWRVLECLWPNVSGHMFPVNRRWLSAVGGEDRIWTPTLYLGLMPLVIALSRWRVRTRNRHLQWLSLVAVGSLIASFGWYGLGWIAGEVQSVFTGERPTLLVGEPTGGLYWLMVKLLPGYGYFRYPAKLWVITSLAISLLSGLGLDRALTLDRARVCRVLGVLGTCSLAAGVVFAMLGVWWSQWFAESASDELFGPLDSNGAWRGCLLACTQALVLCSLFWWLLRKTNLAPVSLGQVILLVTAVEMAWANGSHVVTAPAQAMRTPGVPRHRGLQRVPPSGGPAPAARRQSPLAGLGSPWWLKSELGCRLQKRPPGFHGPVSRWKTPPAPGVNRGAATGLPTASAHGVSARYASDRTGIWMADRQRRDTNEGSRPSGPWCAPIQRIYRPPRRRWVPRQWLKTSSRQRCEATVRWDRATLFPKYHLLGDFGSIHTYSTMSPRDHGALMRFGDKRHPDPAVLDLLGVRYLVLPEEVDWPDGVPAASTPHVANVRVWQNRNAMPRAWVVHRVEAWTPQRSVETRDVKESSAASSAKRRAGRVRQSFQWKPPIPAAVPSPTAGIENRLRRLLYPENRPRDFAQEAVVESREPIPAVFGTGVLDTCRIVEERANRFEVEASLRNPGLLVVSNRYDPGWSVELVSEGSGFQPRIVRANVVMQGVFLPAGTHRLVFRYVPRGFHFAAAASLIGCLLCLVWGVLAFGYPWPGVPNS